MVCWEVMGFRVIGGACMEIGCDKFWGLFPKVNLMIGWEGYVLRFWTDIFKPCLVGITTEITG